jgi:hypothetical protein
MYYEGTIITLFRDECKPMIASLACHHYYLPLVVQEKQTHLEKMSFGLDTAEKYGPWKRRNNVTLYI